ncbi:LysM peptidoglycan-binding domain-containing protein [Aestuariivita boseongensis]|uniref:LysM peptidoglycan-binding domain-containing protein n=1 Tax=Aestuariivita boseongensis TaxID=1470562 RepID=UPI00155DD81B|nr:LysM domain-containing protein [Aestuariivita boseongensis]
MFLASTSSALAEKCDEYDLFQFGFFAKIGAGFSGVPPKFCKSCGGEGELACGDDDERTCDRGLVVYPRISGLADRIEDKMSGTSLPDFAIDEVSDIVNRIRFCLPATPLARKPLPATPPDITGERGARSFLLIPGMGGNIPANAFLDPANSVRRLMEEKYHRVYAVNYNAGHARENGRLLPVQIFRVEADGTQTLVYSGTRPIDGRALDFLSIARQIVTGLQQIDMDEDLTITAYSMGGYVAKTIVYNHFEELLRSNIRIRDMVFAAHPHFAEGGLSGSDIASLFCSELAQGTFLDGFAHEDGQVDLPAEVDYDNPVEMTLRLRNELRAAAAPVFDELTEVSTAGSLSLGGGSADAQVVIGQTCTLGKWLHSWNMMMFQRVLRRDQPRTIDARDYPFINWTFLAGANSVTEPDDMNFYTEDTPSDGRTPVYSAMGRDGARKFTGPNELAADFRRAYPDCGHDYDCLVLKILDSIDQGPPRPGVPYAVKSEESLWSVAQAAMAARGEDPDSDKVDAYWRLLADANGMSLASSAALAPDQVLNMPVPGRVVQEGDTLYDIAGGDWTDLHRGGRASFGGNPDLIYPGRYIPE